MSGSTDRAGPAEARQPEQLRDLLLDAAAALIGDRGWRQTRMADVAAAAGVSRQTLYQYYGTRGALEGALVLRETDRFLTDVERAVAEHPDDAQAATSAAFEVFLGAVAQNTLIKS